MNKQTSISDGWAPCPKGAIAEAKKVRVALSRRRLLVITGSAAVGCFATIGAMAFGYRFIDRRTSAITCSDLQRLLADYHAGRLVPAIAAQVTAHLNLCRGCRQYYLITYPDDANRIRSRRKNQCRSSCRYTY